MSENDDYYPEDFPMDFHPELYYGDADVTLRYDINESLNRLPLSSSHSLSTDYKIAYPNSMEIQVRKFRLNMEPWREVLLIFNDMLLWKKQWHPTALLTGSTLFFILLWYYDPHVLTIISLIGLLLTIADFLLPIFLSFIFKERNWSLDKQKEYEDICTNIILYKAKAELVFSSYNRMRVTNPKLYFFLTVALLSFLTWFGGTMDNCILTYLFVTFLLMLPGMQKQGMLKKTTETFTKVLNRLIENAKTKMAQKKIP